MMICLTSMITQVSYSNLHQEGRAHMYVYYSTYRDFTEEQKPPILGRIQVQNDMYVYLVSWFKFGLLMDEKTYILLYSLYPPVLLDGSVMLYTIVSRIVNLRDPKFDPHHGLNLIPNLVFYLLCTLKSLSLSCAFVCTNVCIVAKFIMQTSSCI